MSRPRIFRFYCYRMGCRAGNAETSVKLGDRVVVQLIIFEEPLPLFAHGNTSPRHGRHLLAESNVKRLPRICVTYVPEWFNPTRRYAANIA